MGDKRKRYTGRKSTQPFVMLLLAIFGSQQYALLSPRAVKCLIDIYCQYRGANNGDLSTAWKIMQRMGWASKDQLQKAVKELLDAQWIEITRQGGRHLSTLYAVTFKPVDECGGKLDVQATTVATNAWSRSDNVVPFIRKTHRLPRALGQSAPPRGSMTAQFVGSVPRHTGQ